MMEFADSTILSSWHVTQVLETGKCSTLDKIDLDKQNIIAGPYNINNNHWLAFIIDIIRLEFILLDPMNHSPSILDKCFQSWSKYYNSRNVKKHIEWTVRKIKHPLQQDHFNCGVFVINLIKNYILNDIVNENINFDCSSTSLECDRQLISSAIENYKEK
jgi:Ulp1 family protease